MTIDLKAKPNTKSPFWYVEKSANGYIGTAIKVGESRKEIKLNTLGALILLHCNGTNTFEDIVNKILPMYPKNLSEKITSDIYSFIELLDREGVIDINFDPLLFLNKEPKNFFI